jgi:hypothetical protein
LVTNETDIFSLRNYLFLTVPCHLRLVYIGKVCTRKCQRYRDALLALATLSGVTPIGSFLLAKPGEEGDIAGIIAFVITGVIPLNFADGNTALSGERES